jgi:surfeit locus 1 family protein
VAETRRPGVVASLVVLLAFCCLIALGVWQVQRLKWKTDLLARIAALQSAPAQPIEAVLRRERAGADINYTRVRLDCAAAETGPVLRLYAVYQGLAGYRLITACPLPQGPYGVVLVDRGFIGMQGGEQPRDIPGRRLDAPLVGVLRLGDRPNMVTPKNQPDQNLWYWRDVPAMAAALHAARPAPAFLMLESPAPSSGEPRPAPLPVNIPNNHLGYAITWFGLAAALVGVYLALLFRKRSN